jgi:hypothetical protein
MPIRHGGIAASRTSPLLPQYDRAASIEPDDMERILAKIDAHRGNGRD